jgi:hypothetical protein
MDCQRAGAAAPAAEATSGASHTDEGGAWSLRDEPAALLTGGQLADRLGVTAETVRKWAVSGKITIAGQDARGRLYRLDQAEAQARGVAHAGLHGGRREGSGRKPRITRHAEDDEQRTLHAEWAEQDRLAEVEADFQRLSTNALEKRERIVKVRAAEQAAALAARTLLPALDVELATRELLQSLRGAIESMPAIVAAEIAAELGADQAVTLAIVRRAMASLVMAVPDVPEE